MKRVWYGQLYGHASSFHHSETSLVLLLPHPDTKNTTTTDTMATNTQTTSHASFASLTPALTLRTAQHLRANSSLYTLLGKGHGASCNCHLLKPDDYYDPSPERYIDPALGLSCAEKKLRIQLFDNAERTYIARDTDWDWEFTGRQREVLRESVK
jgi:hypothetical protein